VLNRLEAAGLAGVFATQEMPLVPVLAQLETAGMLFDLPAAQRYRAEIAHAMDLLQREAAAAVGGRAVNLGSAQQVARLLFDELGLCPAARKRTGTGARLSASKVLICVEFHISSSAILFQEVLQELREEHPIPGLVLRFRKLQKLSSTWLDGLAAQVRTEPDAVRGCLAPAPRLCSEWLQTSTRTGRLSSANPNFQNLPVRASVIALPDHAQGGLLREVTNRQFCN
jgi:DNA polymerase-1